LRHSYAVVALRKLDMDGIDLYSEIPILSTYMGHENLYGTEHYLHMTVENSQDIRYKMDEFNKGLFPEVAE
jgi:integrase